MTWRWMKNSVIFYGQFKLLSPNDYIIRRKNTQIWLKNSTS